MQRVRASASTSMRVMRASSSSISLSMLASATAAAAPSLHAAAASAVSAQAVRAMSAGGKRDKGMPLRRAGGARLPDADHNAKGHWKSSRAYESEEKREEANALRAGEGTTASQRKQAHAAYEAAEQVRRAKEEREKSSGLPEFAEEMREREPLRPGEQSFREHMLARAGITQQPKYKADRSADLAQRIASGHPSVQSTANARNPVLIRARQHLNPADLPPSFDHFNVPALSAAEIDEKEKELHASYWTKYAAWKDARPDEYAKWLDRLDKREQEQDYHFLQAQIKEANKRNRKTADAREKQQIAALHREAMDELLPAKHRADFEKAAAADPALQDAVKKLGAEEVLRRWSAYQVFLDAEMASESAHQRARSKRSRQIQKEAALTAEDPLLTLHDPKLNMSIEQRKKIYRVLLGAKRKTAEAPFWTDPDPRFEGVHDWKMADAFVKPPILPPLHQLRAYSHRYDTNRNFSALHKFLHFERLRQTVTFLKEAKKKVARANVRATRDMSAHLHDLIAATPSWEHIKSAYPFLSDSLLAGLQGLHLAPWAQKDQQDFLTALHRNVVLIAKLLDSHFSRRNRNASWILSYPLNPRTNPDEVLRAINRRDLKKMEAQVLAQQLMERLEQKPELVGQMERAELAQDQAQPAAAQA